jgi:coenzyme F420-reducing hydrogenase delta subunit/ferredoxin
MSSPGFRQRGLNAWEAASRLFDAAFGSGQNPLRHLGAIGFLAFWMLAVTGIVLYILLDTSVDGAYRSIDGLASAPLGLGLLLRGLHRYAADVLVLAMGLHLLREWLYGHEQGFRRYAWLTGVPLIGFVFVSAVGGFWLNWDQLGQFSAIATAEWLDALPLLATPLARNFLGADAVNDRLFSLFVFVHLGVPLMLLFGLWFHIKRLALPEVLPPRGLAVGLTLTLALLALAAPVTSHPPAALARVPEALRLDWMLLFVHPLVDATSTGFVWVLVGTLTIALFALPFLPASSTRPAVAPRVPVAVVDAANCNGCRRCFADCPYAAITMVPHPNQRIGRTLAVVDADLCAACGICAGSCPSSTPFRSAAQLLTGIDMPQRPVSDLRARLHQALQASRAERPLVVFGCDHGARCQDAAEAVPDVVAISLLCSGQLPPSFVEYALRDGAAGVVVATCRAGGCEYRFGERWTIERLQGQREPHLRASVDPSRLEIALVGAGDEEALAAATQRLRLRVQSLMPRTELIAQPSHA